MYLKYLKKLPVIILMSSVPLISSAGEADNTGWYVGGDIAGVATTAKSKNVFTQKKSVASLGAYGGYNFNEWFGLEGMLTVTGDVANNRANLDTANFLSLTMTPKFTHRLSPIASVYAKGGFIYLSYREEYSNNAFPRGSQESWSSATGLTLGVGALFDMSNKIKLRIAYDHIEGSLKYNESFYFVKPANVQAQLNRVSVGVHYQF